MTIPRPLLRITLILFAAFFLSVAMRGQWMGHLAKGDHWTTAQTLRFLKAWHRDGVWESRLGMVLSPPTTEFEGEKGS